MKTAQQHNDDEILMWRREDGDRAITEQWAQGVYNGVVVRYVVKRFKGLSKSQIAKLAGDGASVESVSDLESVSCSSVFVPGAAIYPDGDGHRIGERR